MNMHVLNQARFKQVRSSNQVRMLALALLVCAPAILAQAPAGNPGVVKKILNQAGQAAAAGNQHAAAVNAVVGSTGAKGAAGRTAPAPPRSATKAPAPPRLTIKDPFVIPLKPTVQITQPANLPPGQAGLVVANVELRGIVKTPSGFRAVALGPGGRTYFLKVGDKVYNGRVTKITDDSMTFEENVVDPLGRQTTRVVVKNMPAESK